MKRITKFALFTIGLVVLAGLAGVAPGFGPLAESLSAAQAATDDILTFDVACDCRTGSPSFFTGTRNDPFIVSGKIFPVGKLPSGSASNDPTQPVNGVAPIGDWTCRGQVAFPFPPAIAAAYSSTPPVWNTQYFLLNDGRALTVEGYVKPGFAGELLSLTGGIKGFSGASGFVEEAPFATNATGCPNFHAKFHILAGSVRGASNN
jgi:hypothetical protein